MYIPISQDVNKFYVNIEGTTYPVKKMLLNTQEVTGVEVYADYYSQYFTIESLEDNNVILCYQNTQRIQYYSNGSWNDILSTGFITLNTGDKVMLKGTNTNFNTNDPSYCCRISARKNFKVYGNIMSLLYGDDFEDNNTLQQNYTFAYLFYDNDYKTLVDASNLKLPATTLTSSCYYRMFYGRTSLVKGPSMLPATTLTDSCYSYMFQGCTSLTQAPELPATTLANYCYDGMFSGCTSLVNAPVLPATTLANYCYEYMFSGCTSLTIAPVLPATILANYCYQYMFRNCTSLTTAPELLADTLSAGSYREMFSGCSNLNEIVCLATDISASDCLFKWLFNTASTGIFYKDSTMNDFVVGTNVPTGWTIQNYN